MAFSNARKSLAASRTAAAAVAATGAPVAAPPSPAEREIREKAAEVAAWAESKGAKLGARPKGGRHGDSARVIYLGNDPSVNIINF